MGKRKLVYKNKIGEDFPIYKSGVLAFWPTEYYLGYIVSFRSRYVISSWLLDSFGLCESFTFRSHDMFYTV